MERNGLALPDRWVVRGDYTARTAALLAAELFATRAEDRPTAILTVNLQSALGLLSAGRAAAVRFPDDLSLVTIDDHPILDHVDPPLTAIRLPMAEMGEAGAELLIDVVRGATPRHVVTVTPPRLVVRASSQRVA
jgi:LacI family transcriptional regulator